MSVSKPRFNSFAEFWPYYLSQHRKPQTRALHYAGMGLAALCLGAALVTGAWAWAVAAVIGVYAPAWTGHAIVERNRPATFSYPYWSILGDCRMTALALSGRLKAELARYEIG